MYARNGNHLGLIWAIYRLSGHGLELVTHVWVLDGLSVNGLELVTHVWVLYMGYVWAKWARLELVNNSWVSWAMYGLSGHVLELVTHISGSRLGCVWGNWAWVGTGHQYLAPTRLMYGLSGHGLELVNHFWVPHGLCVG